MWKRRILVCDRQLDPTGKVVVFWGCGKKSCYALIAWISGITPRICIARFML